MWQSQITVVDTFKIPIPKDQGAPPLPFDNMLNLFLCELGFLIHHFKEAYEQEIGLKVLEMAI